MAHPPQLGALPVPDLAALAAQRQQQQIPVSLVAGVQFSVIVPYNANPRRRSAAVETARKLLHEFATGQSPDAPAQ